MFVRLNKVKGPRSFEEIRTVDGICYDTYRDACYAPGLLDDDREYIQAINEAAHSGSGHYLRSLFATMLMTYSLSRPDHVWNNTWKHLSDDILYRQLIILAAPDLQLSDDQIKNLTLLEIERYLLRNNSTLKKWSVMPYPEDESISAANNLLIVEEMTYNNEEMQAEFDSLFHGLTTEQMSVFDNFTEAVRNDSGGVFLVYGYGGTGKTYLWKTLSATIRREGEIVVNVASSGIASLLLTRGRTAHSRFAIPFEVNEDSTCTIRAGTDLSNLLIETKLIIWDEEPNEVVREINDRLLDMFTSEEKVYLSSDGICREDYFNEMFDENLYAPDVLNGLKVSGLPNHKLALKVGVPVMLLRNVDQKNSSCNGTRLQNIALGNPVIEAKIISGINIGHRVFIPRLSLTPSDRKIPFRFQRRQFPVSICFAMTVNKSQGQSLSRVVLLLKEPVFTHGQLYVALSRVKSRSGLKLLILDKDNQVTNTTRNVVYKEVFSYL